MKKIDRDFWKQVFGWDFIRDFFVILAIIVLLMSITKADKLYLTTDIDAVTVDGMIPYWQESIAIDTVWHDDELTMASGGITVGWTTDGRLGISSGCWPNKPDSTTHYWTEEDTVAVLHQVICDTTEMRRYNWKRPDEDSTISKTIEGLGWRTVVEYEVECDSLYILKVTPKWIAKKTMLFTPKEISALEQMLNGTLSIER